MSHSISPNSPVSPLSSFHRLPRSSFLIKKPKSFAMVLSNTLRISNVQQELNRRCTIPTNYLSDLEERLSICFQCSAHRLKRDKKPRSREVYRHQYMMRKAQKAYLEILDDAPHLFIPFILAISPEACQRIKIQNIRKHPVWASQVRFKREVLAILQQIATKQKFEGSSLYERCLLFLFPHGLPPCLFAAFCIIEIAVDSHDLTSPPTGAETDDSWGYNAAHLEAIRNIFNGPIRAILEKSFTRKCEAACLTLKTTESVTMRLPRQNYQDAILSLEVYPAADILEALFPLWKTVIPSDVRVLESHSQDRTIAGPSTDKIMDRILHCNGR